MLIEPDMINLQRGRVRSRPEITMRLGMNQLLLAPRNMQLRALSSSKAARKMLLAHDSSLESDAEIISKVYNKWKDLLNRLVKEYLDGGPRHSAERREWVLMGPNPLLMQLLMRDYEWVLLIRPRAAGWMTRSQQDLRWKITPTALSWVGPSGTIKKETEGWIYTLAPLIQKDLKKLDDLRKTGLV